MVVLEELREDARDFVAEIPGFVGTGFQIRYVEPVPALIPSAAFLSTDIDTLVINGKDEIYVVGNAQKVARLVDLLQNWGKQMAPFFREEI